MADNLGVLGSSTSTTVSTATVYTCPANRAAKFRIFASLQSGASSVVSILVNGIVVANTGSMSVNNFTFTNGGAGLLRAPGAAAPAGTSAAETAQPAAPIYYLSAGQTVQYTVTGAALLAANVQVVGVEIDLAA